MVDHGSPIRTRHHKHVIFVGSNMVAVVAARLALLLISELIGGILTASLRDFLGTCPILIHHS